jgi:isoaspartyl peptidase/L-asparaginase-like protein (Ntn-hydrolase superfamily)
VHGGSGPAGDPGGEIRRGLAAALEAGWRALAAGGSALDAVVAAVEVLEDREEFNAGRGSALTRAGGVEMDAAVMEGAQRRAGAVAGLRRVVHPVRAARAVMERSPHVLLAGPAADEFAGACGLALAEPDHFVTARRRAQLEALARPPGPEAGGTVGAVARDADGHLAAATSTGGVAGKLPGRVSDSALPGAGTWADDATCAVSATGHGEAFVRCAFAHEVDALLRHARLPLAEACERALARVSALGARGGCIALDARGGLALPFSSPAMPRGWIGEDGRPRVFTDAKDVR